MAQLRCVFTAVWLFAYVNLQSQTVYYPAGASELLRSTTTDLAQLLQRGISGSRFETAAYTVRPHQGIVLLYDSSVTGNQRCRVQGNGNNLLVFSAAEDNGLHFGVYTYLHKLGYRFYQPGENWELIPRLSTAFLPVDTLFAARFIYNNWFISGGYTTWALDKESRFYWDIYNGELGHAWSLYMRRNNMTGAYRFAGHRDDVLTPDYLSTLSRNPCYVAPYNGSREANRQSVPDIHVPAAMELWANGIENAYTRYRTTVFGNRSIYPNLVRNYSYAYAHIGIEVPDGARWANSGDDQCGNAPFLSATDQHFTLANYTAARIGTRYPGSRFQLYAYDGHANIPSAGIALHPQLDVQVVPTAFQSETSPKGLLNRWYNRHSHVSEYHYLNIAQWSGENPAIRLDDLQQTLQRVKTRRAQGIVWEAAPSKFASLPYLLAITRSLQEEVPVETTLRRFSDDLFGQAAPQVYRLLQHWGDANTVTTGNSLPDNRYKLPLYFTLLREAVTAAAAEPPVVQERLRELKLYLHYMLLYYRWSADQRPASAKTASAAELCVYLARIRKLQVVNSYALINDITAKHGAGSEIHRLYNTTNGKAYTHNYFAVPDAAETDSLFSTGFSAQEALIGEYALPDARSIRQKMKAAGMEPAPVIRVQVGYTNGKDYPNRSVFMILADKAGSFQVQYTPRFDDPAGGMINFTVEDADDPLKIITDFTLEAGKTAGELSVRLPAAGRYQLSIVSKNKAAVQLTFHTGGFHFYREGPFLGNTVENYRADLLSLPGWFYVPAGISRVYFSLNNSNPGGAGFAGQKAISEAFAFRDADGNPVEPELAQPGDSALWYLPVAPGTDGRFWQAFKMEQYRLCFANISNHYWYARRMDCGNAIQINTRKQGDGCFLTAGTRFPATTTRWELYQAGRWYSAEGQRFELPPGVSPQALLTVHTGSGCRQTVRLGDMADLQACSAAAPEADPEPALRIYPNPGNGQYNILHNGGTALADEIQLFSGNGTRVAAFRHTSRFNISQQPSGLYFYRISLGNRTYQGRLVKQ